MYYKSTAFNCVLLLSSDVFICLAKFLLGKGILCLELSLRYNEGKLSVSMLWVQYFYLISKIQLNRYLCYSFFGVCKLVHTFTTRIVQTTLQATKQGISFNAGKFNIHWCYHMAWHVESKLEHTVNVILRLGWKLTFSILNIELWDLK